MWTAVIMMCVLGREPSCGTLELRPAFETEAACEAALPDLVLKVRVANISVCPYCRVLAAGCGTEGEEV